MIGGRGHLLTWAPAWGEDDAGPQLRVIPHVATQPLHYELTDANKNAGLQLLQALDLQRSGTRNWGSALLDNKIPDPLETKLMKRMKQGRSTACSAIKSSRRTV